MTLIKSISGIRGTIGGQTGDTLNPLDIVKFTTAYATFIGGKKIVVGRDGRISGLMVRNVVVGTLMGMGYDVIDIGYATTPTTELAVRMAQADGGIIITASHNPRQWNALKLLNSEGEFLTAADGAEVLRIAEAEDFHYAEVDQLGTCTITTDPKNFIGADCTLKAASGAEADVRFVLMQGGQEVISAAAKVSFNEGENTIQVLIRLTDTASGEYTGKLYIGGELIGESSVTA